MATNSLFPGYILIDYHSQWGPHKMILPTRAWNPVSSGGTLGSYTDWSGSTVDAESMLDAFTAKLKVFHLPTSSLDAATIYTIASVGAPAIPVAGKAISLVGTSTLTTQAKAAESHLTFRDTMYNLSGIELLDAPVEAGFEPVIGVPSSGTLTDLVGLWTSTSYAWSSRAGFRPSAFRKSTYNLNNDLRKKYGMR